MLRIVLTDDHALFRNGIRLLLESVEGYEVVAEFNNADELQRKLRGLKVDLVILDHRMPGGGSIAALEYIKKVSLNTKVIVLTGVRSGSLFQYLIDSHADGIILKDASSEELLSAVIKVVSGEKVLSPSVQDSLLKGKPNLTPREFQVLNMVVEGLSTNEIAERLGLSNKTVESHRYSLSHKLGVKNAVELVHYVQEHGLLEN